MAGRGGSILRSSRAPALAEAGARERLRAVMRWQKIDNLLIFGGDGTLRHALPLLESWGLSCIALPTTIDNDVAGTDYTLGHDSALQFLPGPRSTAFGRRHWRCRAASSCWRRLGAPSGHLALAIARSSGAHAVLLPEYEVDLDWLAEAREELRRARGLRAGGSVGSGAGYRADREGDSGARGHTPALYRAGSCPARRRCFASDRVVAREMSRLAGARSRLVAASAWLCRGGGALGPARRQLAAGPKAAA